MARYARSDLGILIPVGDPTSAAQVPSAEVYLSGRDLGRSPMGEDDLVELLRGISVRDCLVAIAHLNTRLFAETRPQKSGELQLALVEQMLGSLAPQVLRTLASGMARTVFCEQQLVHLARLVLLHGDRRPRDDFGGGALLEDWGRCLIGVNDLLDAGVDVVDAEQGLSWELRQCGLNHHEDQLPSSGLHYEVYRVLWPELRKGRYEQVETSFQRHAGMTIADYFTVGAAVLARLAIRGANQPTVLPAIMPSEYFSSGELEESTWRAFFTLTARDLDVLRDELLAESAGTGPSTYGSLTFERYPLVEVEDGVYTPLSMRSLQRRVTGGVFHLLSEAAETEGKDRRTYSSRFGRAFQQSVENTLRRGVAVSRHVAIVADEPYGPRTHRRDTSDVILGYDRNPVFVEVVSGPLQARTITHGDLTCFGDDVDRLVVGKASQLDQCIKAFFADEFQVPGIDPATVAHAWPVIVTSHPFPHMPRIIAKAERRVREAGHLRGERVGGLAIVSAEELFFCEGFMQQGRTFLSLIRGWKTGPYPDISFKNHLIAEGHGRAPSSDHFVRRFEEFNAENMRRVLGQHVEA
jgi:hypothetical protein